MNEPFGPDFYAWWAGLSPFLRYGVALLVMILALIIWYADWGGPYFGVGLVIASVVLLLLARGFKGD